MPLTTTIQCLPANHILPSNTGSPPPGLLDTPSLITLSFLRCLLYQQKKA